MIEDRSAKLAYDLHRDYGNERIQLLCILKVCDGSFSHSQGGHTFFSALTRHMQRLGMRFSYDFMRVKSYSGTESTGNGTRVGLRSS